MYTVSNAFGRIKRLQFDLEDRPTNSVDVDGVSVSFTFDNLGRVLTSSYPDGGVEKFGYSAAGLVAYTNQLGLTNFYAYDPAGRKTFETNANRELTQFQYAPSGDLTNLVDAKNQSTKWNYDQYGRVTNKVDTALNTLFQYGYDPNDRLTNRWTPTKGTTTYRYDPAGNLTNVVYPANAALSLAYDALNRLTNMVDAVGATHYSYDGAGQLLSEDGPWPDDTVSYVYTNRLRASLSVLEPSGSPWNEAYGYDAAKRLKTLASPAGAFSYAYAGVGQAPSPASLVQQLTLPSGAFVTNTYDSVARVLTTRLLSGSGAALDSQAYGYDLAGRQTWETNLTHDYRAYTYDKIDQLLGAIAYESNGTTRLQEQLGYQYDAAHNLTSRTNNAFWEEFSVNSLNELSGASRATSGFTVAGTTTSPATNVTVNGSTADLYADSTFALGGFTLANGNNTFTAIAEDALNRRDTNGVTVNLPASSSYSYDLNGNLLSDGIRNFAYDDENQLTSVWVTNNWRSDFVYDGKFRRRLRFESAWNGSAWVTNTIVRYVYDGNLVIQERYMDAQQLVSTPLKTISYTRGTDLSGLREGAGGIGGLLARTDSGLLAIGSIFAHAYYHADALGNVTALINANNSIVAKYLYDAFGRILSQAGTLAEDNLYWFSSKEFHVMSELLYYLFRYYDPSLQRWANRDPVDDIGFALLQKVGAQDSSVASEDEDKPDNSAAYANANLYLFVMNNPQYWSDAFGLKWSNWPPIKWIRKHCRFQCKWKKKKKGGIPAPPSSCSGWLTFPLPGDPDRGHHKGVHWDPHSGGYQLD